MLNQSEHKKSHLDNMLHWDHLDLEHGLHMHSHRPSVESSQYRYSGQAAGQSEIVQRN